MPSLNQISNLRHEIDKEPEHYGIFDFSNFISIMETKSDKQYWYINKMVRERKYLVAKQLLASFGVKHKEFI